MSSDNHLIWIFVAFVAMIEVVSRKPILREIFDFNVKVFGFAVFSTPGEEVRVAFDTNDEKNIQAFPPSINIIIY